MVLFRILESSFLNFSPKYTILFLVLICRFHTWSQLWSQLEYLFLLTRYMGHATGLYFFPFPGSFVSAFILPYSAIITSVPPHTYNWIFKGERNLSEEMWLYKDHGKWQAQKDLRYGGHKKGNLWKLQLLNIREVHSGAFLKKGSLNSDTIKVSRAMLGLTNACLWALSYPTSNAQKLIS